MTFGLWSLLSAATVGPGCGEEVVSTEATVRVEAGPPWVRDVEVTLRYPIELEADESVAVMPVAISGRLRKVLVDVGDKVKAGQLVALVDCREYAAQRTQAETSITKWEAQVSESRTRRDRLVAMGEGKLVAPAEIDRAQADARIAEAQLADARAKLSEAAQRQGYCSLTAPFDGFVIQRYLDAGAMVSPGHPVVNVAKTREVRVVASIVEQDAPKVTRGAEVDLALHAFPDKLFRARVSRLGRSLDPTTRTLRVEIDIPNASEELLPGMTGRAAIVIGKRADALLVPVTAVSKLEDTAYVYLASDEEPPRARRVEVQLGVDLGDWLEIREGLSATDRVIMIGRDLVDDGTRVDVVEPTTRPPAAPRPQPATPEPREVDVEGPAEPAAAPTSGGPGPEDSQETAGTDAPTVIDATGDDPPARGPDAGEAPAVVDPAAGEAAKPRGAAKAKKKGPAAPDPADAHDSAPSPAPAPAAPAPGGDAQSSSSPS